MIKKIDQELFKIFHEWCDHWKFPKFHEVLMPQRAYMAFINENPIVTGFLYKDETAAFSMLEWIVSNPDATEEEMEMAFNELIEHVKKEAKNCGAIVIFTTAKNKSLESRLIKNGIKVTDSQMTHFLGEV